MATELEKTVEEALAGDGRITSKHIHVHSNGGTITLKGVVDSLAELGIAQEIAESVSGVKYVINELEIDAEVDTGPCCPQM